MEKTRVREMVLAPNGVPEAHRLLHYPLRRSIFETAKVEALAGYRDR